MARPVELSRVDAGSPRSQSGPLSVDVWLRWTCALSVFRVDERLDCWELTAACGSSPAVRSPFIKSQT